MTATRKAPKRRRSLLVDARVSLELLGDDCCMWAKIPPDSLHREPLPLPDGRSIEPGATVTNLGGKHASAGFTRVRMHDGHHLTFLGISRNIDCTLAVFSMSSAPDEPTRVVYHHAPEHSCLFHFTSACAGRQVELTHCEFTNPPTT